MNRIILVKIRSVFFQRIAVARNDIVRQNAAHDEVHAGKVVRVFLELLRKVFDMVVVAHVPGDAFTDIDEQRAGTTGGVVNPDFRSFLQVVCNDLGHEEGNLMRRVELTGLLPGIGSEIADQVFINEAKDIIILPAIHGNNLDEIDLVSNGLGTRTGSVPKLG